MMPLYTSLISAGIIAFVISTALCPLGFHLYKWLCKGLVNEDVFLQNHEGKIPRSGGLGIVLGFWLTVAIILTLRTELIDQHFIESNQISFIYWLAGFSLGIFCLGAIGDIIKVNIAYKLAVQIIIAVITAIILLPIQKINLPFLGPTIIGDWGIFFTSCWIIVVMNVLSLIDGLDSLAGGVTIIAMVGVVVLCLANGNMLFLTLGLTLMMAVSGFLFYNSPPKVHLGDGGSMFLGYLIAVLPLLQIKTSTGEWELTPLLLIGVPLVDVTFSFFRKFLRVAPFISANKRGTHLNILSDGLKLISKNSTHRQSVLALHIMSIAYLGIFIASSLGLMPIKLGIITFLAISALLVTYAGYTEAITSTKTVTKHQPKENKSETMSVQFCNNLDFFLGQTKTVEEIFFISSIWAKQIQAKKLVLIYGKKSLTREFRHAPDSKSQDKDLNFKREDLELNLTLESDLLDLYSEKKLAAINKISNTLLDYLEKEETL